MATPDPQPREAQLRRRQKALEVGRAVRFHDSEAETVARRELAAIQLEQYIERVLAKAPALTDAEVRSLSALLRGGAK